MPWPHRHSTAALWRWVCRTCTQDNDRQHRRSKHVWHVLIADSHVHSAWAPGALPCMQCSRHASCRHFLWDKADGQCLLKSSFVVTVRNELAGEPQPPCQHPACMCFVQRNQLGAYLWNPWGNVRHILPMGSLLGPHSFVPGLSLQSKTCTTCRTPPLQASSRAHGSFPWAILSPAPPPVAGTALRSRAMLPCPTLTCCLASWLARDTPTQTGSQRCSATPTSGGHGVGGSCFKGSNGVLEFHGCWVPTGMCLARRDTVLKYSMMPASGLFPSRRTGREQPPYVVFQHRLQWPPPHSLLPGSCLGPPPCPSPHSLHPTLPCCLMRPAGAPICSQTSRFLNRTRTPPGSSTTKCTLELPSAAMSFTAPGSAPTARQVGPPAGALLSSL